VDFARVRRHRESGGAFEPWWRYLVIVPIALLVEVAVLALGIFALWLYYELASGRLRA
jgi:hypothetical protein